MPATTLLTRNGAMQALIAMAQRVAPTGCNVLITGESGTGKELFARVLHEGGPHPDGPFIAVNCGAFNEELLANELFGSERGAFTGAPGKLGLIVAAQAGTLFLDEITEMSPAMQVKLLRAIQEKEVLPLGATEAVKVDVRFIAASNRDMKDWVAEGRFRQDLYFRLNVVNLHIPPLSQRREDIPLLARHFLKMAAPRMGRAVAGFADDALELLRAYDYPGNVRELENIVERLLVYAAEVGQLEYPMVENMAPELFTDRQPAPLSQSAALDIAGALAAANGNLGQAAKLLGISRTTLWRRVREGAAIDGQR